MKRLLLIALALVSGACSAQTFKVQNLDVLGTSTLTGLASFAVRPTFNGNTPWDSGNLNTSIFAPVNSPTFTGTVTIPSGASIAGYAPLASPALTGAPTAPTAATGTNTTQLATTAFVASHSTCQSIMDHGGNNGGVVDNSTALLATVAAGPTGSPCVFFPPGAYAFSGNVTITLANTASTISLLGSGNVATSLIWPSGGGLTITMPGGSKNAAHIRDMSLLSGVAGGGNGIFLNNATAGAQTAPIENSDITNVSLHGSDGYGQSDYWNTGILVQSWSSILFNNIQVYGAVTGSDLAGYCGSGTGIDMVGNTGSGSNPPLGVIYNITGSQFNCLLTGINNGVFAQGITINQSNFVANRNGITTSTGSGSTQITVMGSQFNVSDNAILDTVGVPDFQIIGNTFLVPVNTFTGSSAAISLQPVFSAQIVGNAFYVLTGSPPGAGTFGVIVASNSYVGAVITGNSFANFATAIQLTAASSGNNVQSNIYSHNTTNVVNSGAGNTLGGVTGATN